MQKIAEGVASYERLLKNTRKKKKTEHLQGVWKSSSMRLLAVLSLLFCVVVCVDQARAEMQAVKLCGREFLRAVVYTCGGSRWRRFFSEPDMGGESFSFHSLTLDLILCFKYKYVHYVEQNDTN